MSVSLDLLNSCWAASRSFSMVRRAGLVLGFALFGRCDSVARARQLCIECGDSLGRGRHLPARVGRTRFNFLELDEAFEFGQHG